MLTALCAVYLLTTICQKTIIMSLLYPIFEAFPKAVYQMDTSRKQKRIVKFLVCHVTLQQFPRRTDSLQDILPTLEHDRNTWKVADLFNGCSSEMQSWISLKIHSKLAKKQSLFLKVRQHWCPTPPPGDNWKWGILQRVGWGWLCSALSALSGLRTSGSLPLWQNAHPGSG